MPAIRGNDYAVGNDGGAPPGNDNAAGNDGGPPEGNANAAKHHGWSDPLKHYHRLAGFAREWVDDLLGEHVEHYALVHRMDTETVEADAEVMDRLRALAAMHHQWRLATAATSRDGLIVEREREYEKSDGETVRYTTEVIHPAENASLRISQRQRNLRADLGIDFASIRKAEQESDLREQLAAAVDDLEDTPRFE